MSAEEAVVVSDLPLALPWNQAAKRILDILGSVFGLALLSPLFALLSVLVRLDSPGPIFFSQMRVGKGGRLFNIIKFRSMHPDGDEILAQHFREEPERRLDYELYQKIWHDPRLTRSGRLLRRTSLDELPQLINVLKGDMSLVGPRPFLPDQQAVYGQVYDLYISTRPGMTGLWQVSGRNQLSFVERVQLDYDYLTNWSLWEDVVILIKTAWTIFDQPGAY